jgi:ABC-type nickel/cobalt efflux system permease component RcnA
MPIALAVNVANAGITALVARELSASALPLAWFCVVLLVTAGRWVIWRQHCRASVKGIKGDPRWGP